MYEDGIIPIKLDKERNLKFSFGALKRFERHTGKKLLELDGENIELNDVSAMVWAGLSHEDKQLTVEDVEDLIHLGNINYVQGRIKLAFESVQQNAKEIKEEKNEEIKN